MKSIPLTQGKFAIVDDEDFAWLNQWKWHVVKDKYTFYASRYIGGRNKKARISMHRLIAETPKGLHTDHINHEGLDNRKSNLRIVSPLENQRNLRPEFVAVGAYWDKKRERWVARIRHNGKRIGLGHFKEKEDAMKAYADAVKKLHKPLPESIYSA